MKNIKHIKNYIALTTIGITFFVCIVIGYGIGYFLDKIFATSPYLMLLFVIFGMAAGFLNLYETIKKVQKN